MSEQQSQTTAIEQASRPGDSEPTPKRQAELRTAYKQHTIGTPFMVVILPACARRRSRW